MEEGRMTKGSGGKRYGVVSGDQQRTMSGLEFVQGLVTGTLPMNSMAETLGYDIVEVSNGRAAIVAEPNAAHLNPAGTVHGGLAATLLDSCMGLAVHSTLDRGFGQTTLEFKISDRSRTPRISIRLALFMAVWPRLCSIPAWGSPCTRRWIEVLVKRHSSSRFQIGAERRASQSGWHCSWRSGRDSARFLHGARRALDAG